MYVPRSFAETRPEVLSAFIRRHSFGTLISVDHCGALSATHLPFLLREALSADEPAMLLAHFARTNDQWKSLRPDGEVLVIFTGPHAYVSPRWYQSKLAVPTWNYAAVHVHGIPRIIDDPEAARTILKQTVQEYEGTGPQAWNPDTLPEDFIHAQASAVVVVAIDVKRIEGKFKMSQNRPDADRLGVIAALEADGSENAHDVVALMRKAMEGSPKNASDKPGQL